MIQRVYVLRCPDLACNDPIVLPHQSRLGIFAYPQCQPTGEWPIDYRCCECGLVSKIPLYKIRLETFEAQGRNQLFVVSFSSDHARSMRMHWLYSKLPPRSISAEELISEFLIPTRTWKEEYGPPRFEGIHQI